MQLLRYTRWDTRQFCPVTGQPIVDEEMNPVTPTLRGFWVDEIIDEPVIVDPVLQAAWDKYVAEQEALEEDGEIEMEAFLGALDHPGWVAFEMTGNGIACGPVSNRTWAVLDLEMEIEEDDGDLSA